MLYDATCTELVHSTLVYSNHAPVFMHQGVAAAGGPAVQAGGSSNADLGLDSGFEMAGEMVADGDRQKAAAGPLDAWQHAGSQPAKQRKRIRTRKRQRQSESEVS